MSSHHNDGFTVTELLMVVAIGAVIAALALPSVLNAVNGYRLHSDAANLASYSNIARMKAAAQFAPYRINISMANGTFDMEKLCGDTSSSTDGNCTGPYNSFSTPDIELGTQYASTGDTYSSCRPSWISAYPGDITGDPASCPTLLQIYFNTRGVPVTSSGDPLSNGGAVVYVADQNSLTDAVTFSLGGQVAVWNWDTGSGKWVMR